MLQSSVYLQELKMFIHDLPLDLLIQLRTFLCHAPSPEQFCVPEVPQLFETVEEEEREWRNFLNISRLFSELKRKSTIVILSDDHAIEFIENVNFRNRVESLIEDRSKQLHFHFTSDNFLDKAYFHCNNSQGITIEYVEETIDSSVFSNLKLLELNNTAVSFLCNLQNLLHVTVLECDQLKTISNLPSLQRLHVEACESLESISNLPSLQQLYLNGCRNLTKFSAIPTLEALEIRDCQQFLIPKRFIEPTTNYLGLDFYNQRIKESFFKTLTHLENLRITEAKIPFALSAGHFPSIKNLDFCNCPKLIGFNLPQLHSLTLTNCDSPALSLEHLPALQKLKISYCRFMTQIGFDQVSNQKKAFSTLRNVEIIYCTNLKKITVARKIRFLVINYSDDRPEVIISSRALVQCFYLNDLKLVTSNGSTTFK